MRWKALVVDEHSQRILYNVLKRNDILEENIATSNLVIIVFSLIDVESYLRAKTFVENIQKNSNSVMDGY